MQQQKKILIIKLGALGDVVMASSLMEQIQRHHRDDRLHLLTSPPFQGLFHAWRDLNVTTYSRIGFFSAVKMIVWLRKEKFDRVYDLQSNDRTRFILAFSGIAERVGNHPALPYTISPKTKYTGDIHIFDRMNEVLASAGINPAKPLPHLPSSIDDHKLISSLLK